MTTVDTRKSKFVGSVRHPDKAAQVTSSSIRRQAGSPITAAPQQPAVRGVLNGAIARAKELRKLARKTALQDAVENLKITRRESSFTTSLDPESNSVSHSHSHRGSVESDEEIITEDKAGGFTTFRNAVQKAYDSVGDPEKEGVNQEDITDILSKLGYSEEDRETQNILSAAASLTDKTNVKFQEVFKLVVGRNEEETLADITNAFQIFDRDDDGKLQTKDLHRALTRIGDDPLTEEEFEEILYLAELDPDFDAFFDYKELTSRKLASSYTSSTKKSEKYLASGLASRLRV